MPRPSSATVLVIEKDIPIPEPWKRTFDGAGVAGLGLDFAFRQMAVGDSFLIPVGIDVRQVSARATMFGKRNGGLAFTIKRTDAGYRCWRKL